MAWLTQTRPELAAAYRAARREYDRLVYDPAKEKAMRARTRDPAKEAERKRAWAEAHREERRAYLAKWRAEHPEQVREAERRSKAKYNAKKRAERIAAGWKPRRTFASEEERRAAKREYRRAWYEAHRDPSLPRRVRLSPEERREKQREYNRRYYAEHPELRARYARERMERIYADEERHVEYLKKRAMRRHPEEKRLRPYRAKPSRMRHAWERVCEAYMPGFHGVSGIAFARELSRERRAL
jgi:hypothetical protein